MEVETQNFTHELFKVDHLKKYCIQLFFENYISLEVDQQSFAEQLILPSRLATSQSRTSCTSAAWSKTLTSCANGQPNLSYRHKSQQNSLSTHPNTAASDAHAGAAQHFASSWAPAILPFLRLSASYNFWKLQGKSGLKRLLTLTWESV